MTGHTKHYGKGAGRSRHGKTLYDQGGPRVISTRQGKREDLIDVAPGQAAGAREAADALDAQAEEHGESPGVAGRGRPGAPGMSPQNPSSDTTSCGENGAETVSVGRAVVGVVVRAMWLQVAGVAGVGMADFVGHFAGPMVDAVASAPLALACMSYELWCQEREKP